MMMSLRGGRFFILALVAVSLAFVSRTALDVRAAGFVTVNSNADDNDGTCGDLPGGDCTLREAMLIANGGDIDEIHFAIPGAGPHTITVMTALPVATEAVTIDGLSQPGSSCGPTRAILIQVTDGNAIVEGLRLEGSGSALRGVALTGFDTDVALAGSGQHTLTCSNLGVNAAGTARDTASPAVRVESDGNTIGGAEGTTNLIGGTTGIVLPGGTDMTEVSFNRIGRRMDDTDIDVLASAGISITGSGAGNAIRQNIFGTHDYGVVSSFSPQSVLEIEGNVFTEAPRYGVWLAGQDGGAITIFDNQFLGSQQANASAIRLLGDHGGTAIRGNVFNGTRTGVDADVSDGPVIGGDGPGERNEFIANETAIDLYNSGFNPSAESSIVNNSIAGGEEPAAYSNRQGINVGNRNSGSLLIARNEITGADLAGIDLDSVSNTTISSNLIGIDGVGTISPNGFGIRVGGSGGLGPILIGSNLVVGNSIAGISVATSQDVSISENTIGTPYANAPFAPEFALQLTGIVVSNSSTVAISQNWVEHNGGPGINVVDSHITIVSGNVVANNAGPGVVVTATAPGIIGGAVGANTLRLNGGAGVVVKGPLGVAMDLNTFDRNAGLSIDLGGDGATTNDPLDADSGPNGLLNVPILTWAQSASGALTITGSIQTVPGLVGFLDFYASTQCGQGGRGEGGYEQFLNVEADVNGTAQFTATETRNVPPGSYVSAVLRSPRNFDTGLSSEFSNCVRVVSEAAPNLDLLSTSSATAGGAGFSLRVRGANFNAGAIAFFGGKARPTTVLSESEVLVQLSSADLALTGTAMITVRNPSTAGAPTVPEVSNPLQFTVRASPSADVNCSGGVDGLDALALLRTLAGLETAVCDGDATLDGEVTIADVAHVRLVAAGLLPE